MVPRSAVVGLFGFALAATLGACGDDDDGNGGTQACAETAKLVVDQIVAARVTA